MIAEQYLPLYGPDGLSAFIVHTGDAVLYAKELAVEIGHPFPMLLDLDEAVLDTWIQLRPAPAGVLFPLGYLVDREGVIRQLYNEPEPPGEVSPATLTSDIQTLLAE